MKKHLMIFAVALLAVAIALPAFAAVEFKYGGSWRARWQVQDNVFDGTDKRFSTNYNSDDNRHFIDHRLRLNFSFIGSKNLKLVTGFEIGDAIWGQGAAGSNTGPNLGGNLGGDAVAVEVKTLFVDFNIPNTPLKAIIGLQPLVLMDAWILGDDFPAAVFSAKLDPFKITLGYVGGQNGWERATGQNTIATTDDTFNVDDFFLSFEFAQGPFKASFINLLQFGHDSMMSIDPATLSTPNRTALGNSYAFLNGPVQSQNNWLWDLGLNFTYKVDYLLAYVNFVKNFGGADIKLLPGNVSNAVDFNRSTDYTGWMVDAGVTYFCGPWTANIGGFYTSGPSISDNYSVFNDTFHHDTGARKNFRFLQSNDIEWFTYPSGVQKATSEIIGGGILGEDLHTVRGYSSAALASAIGAGTGPQTVFWKGWYNPMNIWTITLGGSYQVTPSTKISASYWYWGTSAEVPVSLLVAPNPNAGKMEMSNSIGHELNFYLDQKIVDGLTLTLVGAYLFADDAFAPIPVGILSNGSPLAISNAGTAGAKTNLLAEDSFELGARLQWNF